MRKFLFSLLICTLVFSGCKKAMEEVMNSLGVGSGSAADNSEESAQKLSKEITYYNDFLGVSFSVPKTWWLYDVNEDNFSTSQGDITDDTSMDIGYGKTGSKNYANLWMLSFGNLQYSKHDNHLGFDLDARSIEGAGDMASYMKYFEEYMLEPTDEAKYFLTNSEAVTINNVRFELRDYKVDRDEDDYQIMTLTSQIKEGYFFNIIVSYWPENAKAKQGIIDTVNKNLTFL